VTSAPVEDAAYKKKMTVTLTPIADVHPYDANPRIIPDTAIEKVAASIREFGWQQPIVVDGKGVVIAGHTRLAAAKRLGLEQVPVTVAGHLSAAQAQAYRLMDNRSGQDALWDESLLALELGELAGLDDFDLSLTGFTDAEIELALADDLDLPDSVGLDREGGAADAGTSALCWGSFKVPMDAEEEAALTRARNSYVDENATDYGLVGHLLGLVGT
jgi:ParB-like chromosome segregation protein Spo0J